MSKLSTPLAQIVLLSLVTVAAAAIRLAPAPAPVELPSQPVVMGEITAPALVPAVALNVATCRCE